MKPPRAVRIDNGLVDEESTPYIAYTAGDCRSDEDLHLFMLVMEHCDTITLGHSIGSPVW